MSGVEGRTALVTGAGQGIGAAIAHRLARGGASVAVLDLNGATAQRVVDSIRESGGEAIGLCADVGVRVQVEEAVERTASEFGRLDILVNNAGVLRDNLLFKMSDEDWATVLKVHLEGAFLASRAEIGRAHV